MSNVVPLQSKISSDSSLQTQGDFGLINQLLKNPRYKIPEHLRENVINCCDEVIKKKDSPDATKLAACRTVLLADRHNLEMIKLAMPTKIEHYNPQQATDEELIEVLKEAVKLLPPMITQPSEELESA